MTQNAWNTDYPNANGETLIGNGTSRPTSTTITGGSNCTVVNTSGGIQLTYSGATTGDWVLTHSASASNSSELTFTGLSSTYFTYMICVDNFVPANDGDRLAYQTSTDGGSSYDSGSNNYYFRGMSIEGDGTINALDSDSTSTNVLGSGTCDPGNATNETSSGIVYFYNPSASDYMRATSWNAVTDNTGDLCWLTIATGRSQATAVDAFRMFCSGGNITTCEVRVYGLVAS